MSIRWKIAWLCIVLSLLPIVVLHRYTIRKFDRFTRRVHEERMIAHAYVAGDDYRRSRAGEEPGSAFAERLRDYEERFGIRLQIVGTDGSVLFDSSPTPAIGEPLAREREVNRALAGHYGARYALTADRRLMYYYIAIPVTDNDGEVVAAARAVAHTQEITRAIFLIARDFKRAMGTVFGIAALAAVALSFTLTRRLRRLTAAANSFARGDSRMIPARHGSDEIGELGRAFEQMAEEMRRNSEHQNRLMASTTHELKTPLAAIKGSVQILREESARNDAATREKFLSNMELSADRSLRMVEQLAALSKIKTEELRGRKERIRFGAFVRATVERLFPVPPLAMETNVPEEDPLVPVIPERIEQALANLLENAIRYTPPDGKITVTVRTCGDGVETTVQDTGSGIEPSDLPKVFQQFFTTVSKNSIREYGSGLGLAIAQSIVQNHGGTIRVASVPGKGSAFTFFLPR